MVYRADMLGDDGFKRVVALKVLNDDVARTGEVARRFRDEARVLGLLRHRAIVQVDGLVNLGERQALVMEYIDGADLGRIMAIGPVPPEPALEIIGEVANALDVAFHTQSSDGQALGLLHRDVKPSNIRITPAGEVKVLDFGVARADFGSREAVTKSYLLGSNGYMGPERFEGEDGPPTDIYSLGVVLLEMLSGTSFGPTSIRPAKLAQRVDEALAGVSGLSESLKTLVREMTAFEPGDRPSVGEVERRAWELRRTLDGARLRDWARDVVPVAAAKQVEVPEDDLTGHVLVESSQEKEVETVSRVPVKALNPSVPDPGLVDVAFDGAGPTEIRPAAEAGLDASEWDEEQPTVVASPVVNTPVPATHVMGPPSNLARLAERAASSSAAASPAASPAPSLPPPSLPPPALPAGTSADGPGTAGGARREPAVPPPPVIPGNGPARSTIWLGVGIGSGLALLVVALGIVLLGGGPTPAPVTDPAPQEPAFPEAEPPGLAPAKEAAAPPVEVAPGTGRIDLEGDVPSVRLVSVDGRRHRPGVLKPGDYLVSADFGDGARMAGRFSLRDGERIILDCSTAALACTVVHNQ
jgi:serine/threonine-protein kinase